MALAWHEIWLLDPARLQRDRSNLEIILTVTMREAGRPAKSASLHQ
jgi:hypothetical protein